MRPIRKQQLPRIAVYEADRLMGVIGPYCSLCERPIQETPSIWETVRDTLVERIGDLSGDTLLMLCVNCADWQQRTAGTRTELLLPDAATTFRMNGPSPYRYSLERVTVRMVDDVSGEVLETSERDLAIISGAIPAAVRTIDRFRLNTPYYDREQRTMTIPRFDALSLADRRVDLRTDAWNEAQRLFPTVHHLLERQRSAVELLRTIVETSGFWSVWLTQLRELITDRESLLRIFAPASVPPVRRFAAERRGPAPSVTPTLLRGTSTDFLD